MDAPELRSQSEKVAKQTDSLQLDSEAVSKDTSYLFRIWEVKRNCLPGGEEARGPQSGSHRPPRGTTSIGSTQVSCGWNITLGPSGICARSLFLYNRLTVEGKYF